MFLKENAQRKLDFSPIPPRKLNDLSALRKCLIYSPSVVPKIKKYRNKLEILHFILKHFINIWKIS